MEGLAPITFDLEEIVSNNEYFATVLDYIYQALFHEDNSIRIAAVKKLDAMFIKEGFEISNIYSGDNQLFLRAAYQNEDAVFYLGNKPKSYKGNSLDLMNGHFITLQHGKCKSN